jgi:phage terminase large subunit-like protein
MFDLTAAALFGYCKQYDVYIVITHAFFPASQAAKKADEDEIPLFGWKDDGWLTICNSATVNYTDVVNWFISMRNKGFKITQVGMDRKFGREFFIGMKQAKFNITDMPQYFWRKSEGFRFTENAVKQGKFYYLHSEAYEYCVQNVSCIEKSDDMVQYEKIQPEHRIDIFDAATFACCKYLENLERSKKAAAWWAD